MKKFTILIAAIALVCFSVPAMAVEWNFYGNARMATWWDSSDSGESNEKTDGLTWDLQTNSRIGATVKAENISARFELGLKGTNGEDLDVGTRRIEATWDFGGGKLLVGKTYSPVNQFSSGQVHDGDAGLLGTGFIYGGRPGMLQLSFGDFKIALVTPKTDELGTDGSIDVTLPKLDVGWGMAMDAFSFNIMAGVQTYELEDVTTASFGTEDITVTSYMVGGDFGVNFGPGFVKGAISYAVNGGVARWTAGDPTYDGDDDIDDNDTVQLGLVAGMKVSDMLTFEAGGGWRQDDSDADGAKKVKTWEIYGQSVIALAPGVYLIPEIGFRDEGDDVDGDDAGDSWYAGGKWQINF